MGKKLSLRKKGTRSFTYLALGILILSGCATTGTNAAAPERVPIIESLMVDPSPERTVVEISSTESTPYTAFKKVDPLGVILDIRGKPGMTLPLTTEVNSGRVREIRFEESKTQVMTTRMVINMAGPFDYHVEAVEKGIRLTLVPEIPVAKAPEKLEAEERPEVLPVTPSEPRLFFKKGPSVLTQILGIDFTMLDQGKSRLIVTTDRKATYDLDPKGPKALVMKIPEATIPPLIMRRLDSFYFEGAVDRIKASIAPADKGVSIVITLREMVPFHVKQVENEISIDFGRTMISPPEKKIVPLKLAQAQAAPEPKAPAPEQPVRVGVPVAVQTPGSPAIRKAYTGAAMTMDFVNADVTNILRLIAEVSNLNIVWSPDVKGTVSMRLKDVPWDQALDLILDNNNLGMRPAGNVIWITTKAQVAQIEAEERRKIEQYEAKLEAERKKVIAEKEKEKELEPMVTEYMRVDFAKADEITPLITLSEAGKARGAKMSVDPRTNTIIITDIGSSMATAKEIVKEFDTPVKQVMIEARIVDATDAFTRDLGIQWDQFQIQKRSASGVPFTTFGGTPASVDPGDPSGFSDGGRLTSPTFTSNVPTGWSPNMGLVFSKLSGSGLTGTILNAKLALSETEGTAKIISAPKVIAMNGQSATISRGDSIIIQATENVASTTLDATLSLTVTPTVSFNNYITLDVQVTDDSAPSSSRLLKKSINTKLMVKTGETVVIGGIYKEDKGDDESGIPALRRIPFLGWLFKAQSKRITKSELLIFLTPTVISSPVKS
ncbi:MAG: type IV pilus secretin PilQ [Proteobacteria bacterium]|nr:type IV pilus secretin PilQ [Pseudomonadota bacterium]